MKQAMNAQCYIHSVLLYGTETTTYTAKTIKRMEACEMWFSRRIWIKKFTNADVLKRAGVERTLLETVKIGYLARIMKGEKIRTATPYNARKDGRTQRKRQEKNLMAE